MPCTGLQVQDLSQAQILLLRHFVLMPESGHGFVFAGVCGQWGPTAAPRSCLVPYASSFARLPCSTGDTAQTIAKLQFRFEDLRCVVHQSCQQCLVLGSAAHFSAKVLCSKQALSMPTHAHQGPVLHALPEGRAGARSQQHDARRVPAPPKLPHAPGHLELCQQVCWVLQGQCYSSRGATVVHCTHTRTHSLHCLKSEHVLLCCSAGSVLQVLVHLFKGSIDTLRPETSNLAGGCEGRGSAGLAQCQAG